MPAYEQCNPRFGWRFYEISLEATTFLERQIVESVSALIPFTMSFERGYRQAKEELSWHSEQNERIAYAAFEEWYYEQLEREKKLEPNRLAHSALKLISNDTNPKSYEELSRLPIEARTLLAEMEKSHIDMVDCADEYIDGHTSGHHREIRDILKCAARGAPIDEFSADIYMDEEGQFNFNLIEHTNYFATQFDKSLSDWSGTKVASC